MGEVESRESRYVMRKKRKTSPSLPEIGEDLEVKAKSLCMFWSSKFKLEKC